VDVCTFEEYDEVRLRLRYGTDCRQFCHCAHSETIEDGSVLYYWEVQQCPDGTQFKDDGVNAPGCFHEWHVQCPDGMDTSTPHPDPHTTCVEYDPDSIGCNIGDTCSQEEHDDVRLKLLHNSDCEQFCHCAPATTNGDASTEYYWVVQTCPQGTAFSDAYGFGGCFHAMNVVCADGNYTMQTTDSPQTGPTMTPHVPTGAPEICSEGAPCSQYEHDVTRLLALPGTNCTAFCQCAPANTDEQSVVTYKWLRQECPQGLAWDSDYRVCINERRASCELNGYETSTLSSPAPPEDPDSIGCNIGDTCSQEEHDDVRLKLLHNSDCEQFCHCAPATTNSDASTEYYWVVQTCPQGTAFSDAYGFGGCFHAMDVVCADGNYTMQTTDSPQTGPTMTPHVPTGAPEICSEGAPCSQYEHDVTRLLALPGTNCTAFCQCAPANMDEQSVITYQWVRQECPPSLAWDSVYRVCINERRASCELDDLGTSETPLTSNGTSRSTEGTCGHYLNGLEGIIEHPSPFGNRTYGNQEACTWDIEVSSGSVISLTFWVFDVEPVTNCTHDNVTLMENGIVSETLCNITIPYTYTSTTNRLTVKFASDPSVQGIGFQANWSEIANPTSTETPVSTERPADYIECGVYPADIVIVIDGSGSISPNDFQTQLQFVSRIVEEHDVTSANARARIGVVTFSDVVTDYIRLNDYIDDKDGLMARILSIPQRGGTTNTGGALRFVREVILQEGNGARQFAQNIVFVITDGVSTNAADTAAEASNLKTVSSKVFAIAVGDFSVDELYHIASNDDYVKQVQSFDALSSISNELKRESCAAGCIEGGLCTQYEHDEIRHRLLFGTDCSTYCHCATKTTNNDGSVEYYWARVNCPGGTLFNESTTLSEPQRAP
ncbi:COCA1-like protein, partial [Mya arenaria]